MRTPSSRPLGGSLVAALLGLLVTAGPDVAGRLVKKWEGAIWVSTITTSALA
jgi:hypothetical protein